MKYFKKIVSHTSYAKAYLRYRAVLQKLQKENKTQVKESDLENTLYFKINSHNVR